jgi:uncharacterized membrane protein HdeD (DUF308 family)
MDAYRSSAEWKRYRPATVFVVVVMYIPGLILQAAFLLAFPLVSVWAFTFMWGYLYRQSVIDNGRRLRWEFLRLDTDRTPEDRHDVPDRLERFRRRNAWRLTLIASVVLLVAGLLAIPSRVLIAEAIAPLLIGWLAVLAGYHYREHVVESGRCPRWRFLRVTGDCEGQPAPPRRG